MLYELIKFENDWVTTGRKEHFDEPHVLAAHKGKWVERVVEPEPPYDPVIETLGQTTVVTEDAVTVLQVVTAKTIPQVNRFCRDTVRGKMHEKLSEDIDIGGGILSNRTELLENRDLLDGSGPSSINFASGHKKLTVAQQGTVKNNMKSHHRASHKRAHDILELIKAETTQADKVAVLDAELDTGWP